MHNYTQKDVYLFSIGHSISAKGSELKQERHIAIRELLVTTSVASQDELRRQLARSGFHVTQATLSRDIHELRLMKGPRGYALPQQAAPTDDDLPGVADLLHSFGLEIRPAMNLLVVITTTGSAQPVAAAIDYEEWPEVVGTIAGDDTVLVICTGDTQAKAVKQRMDQLLG